MSEFNEEYEDNDVIDKLYDLVLDKLSDEEAIARLHSDYKEFKADYHNLNERVRLLSKENKLLKSTLKSLLSIIKLSDYEQPDGTLIDCQSENFIGIETEMEEYYYIANFITINRSPYVRTYLKGKQILLIKNIEE